MCMEHSLSVSVLHCLSNKYNPPTHFPLTHTHTVGPLLLPLYKSQRCALFEPMAAQEGHIPYNFKGSRIFPGQKLILVV